MTALYKMTYKISRTKILLTIRYITANNDDKIIIVIHINIKYSYELIDNIKILSHNAYNLIH